MDTTCRHFLNVAVFLEFPEKNVQCILRIFPNSFGINAIYMYVPSFECESL